MRTGLLVWLSLLFVQPALAQFSPPTDLPSFTTEVSTEEFDGAAYWVSPWCTAVVKPDAPLVFVSEAEGGVTEVSLWHDESRPVAEPIVTRSAEQTAITQLSPTIIQTVFFDAEGRPTSRRIATWPESEGVLDADDYAFYHFGLDCQVVVQQSCPDPGQGCEDLARLAWINAEGVTDCRLGPEPSPLEPLAVDEWSVIVDAHAEEESGHALMPCSLSNYGMGSLFYGTADPVGLAGAEGDQVLTVQSVEYIDETSVARTAPVADLAVGTLCQGGVVDSHPYEEDFVWNAATSEPITILPSNLLPEVGESRVVFHDRGMANFGMIGPGEGPTAFPIPEEWTLDEPDDLIGVTWQPIGDSSSFAIRSMSAAQPGLTTWHCAIYDAVGELDDTLAFADERGTWLWILNVDPSVE